MHLTTVAQAAAMFVATNIDDLVVLMVFFGRARSNTSGTVQVVVGQYLGFSAILVVSVLGALGAQLVPDTAVAYFGLVPILLGIRAAWMSWRHRDDDDDDWEVGGLPGVGIATVAAVTFANGGDTSAFTSPFSPLLGRRASPRT